MRPQNRSGGKYMSTTRKLIGMLICVVLMAAMIPAALSEGGSAEVGTFALFKRYAESGEYASIKITEDFIATDNVTVNNSLKIELNGKQLDMRTYTIAVQAGTLTVKDSSSGTAGNIVVSENDAKYAPVTLTESGSLVLQSGTIGGDTGTGIIQRGSGSICIDGGLARGDAYAILHSGSGSVTVTDGGALATYGIYLQGTGSVKVTGGSVVGYGCAIGHVGTSGGSVSIEGGSVNCNDSGGIAIQTVAAGLDVSGGVITGAGAAIQSSKANISGGYINGGLQLTSGSELTGGFYTAEPPSAHIPKGYEAVECDEVQGNVHYTHKIICVATTLTADRSNPDTAKVNESFQMKVSLTDSNGDALSGKEIIYSDSIRGTTGSDGTVILTFPGEAKAGKRSYKVRFEGDEDGPHAASECSLSIRIIDDAPLPDTGDDTPVLLPCILALMSIAGIAILGLKARKER